MSQKKSYPRAQNPLLLKFPRVLDAFSKSDDERDFYFDKVEGFLVYADLDKGKDDLIELEKELKSQPERYALLPKMTYYETKKFMEGFVNEKVYDIDTKEKLLDVIQSKEARENFLEFIYDHIMELEKWQQYYLERSRIRIIEWLRGQEVQFVFEEDVDLTKGVLEKLKTITFEAKVPKEMQSAREVLLDKAKTYYSNEALNPRPKRGRPPKQQVKVEVEPKITGDFYSQVSPCIRPFLYLPELSSAASVTFSAKFATEAQLLASLRGSTRVKVDPRLQALSERLESLHRLSSRLTEFQDLGGGREEKLIKVMSTQMPEKRIKIKEVVKEILPQERKMPVKDLKRKQPGIKTVTHLKKKR